MVWNTTMIYVLSGFVTLLTIATVIVHISMISDINQTIRQCEADIRSRDMDVAAQIRQAIAYEDEIRELQKDLETARLTLFRLRTDHERYVTQRGGY